MGYAQLFQGILMFPDKEAFEEAMAVIAEGTEVQDDAGERETFRKAMVSDLVMVLHYDIYQPASSWFETNGRLFQLAERAARGYLVSVFFGDGIDLEVIGVTPRPVNETSPSAPVAPEVDFFPMYEGARYDYETRFGGDVSVVWWSVKQETLTSRGTWYSFPIEGGSFNHNDYLGGSEFLSVGNRLYVPAQHESHGSIDSLPDAAFQLIADADSPVGTAWLTHIPGTESLRMYKHLGFEDVATADAFYSGCLKLQLNDRILSTWQESYSEKRLLPETFTNHISYLYFAKGVGLVKIGFPDGEIILKSFHRDGKSAPPPPKRPTEDMKLPEDKYQPKSTSAKPKRPWWKFW